MGYNKNKRNPLILEGSTLFVAPADEIFTDQFVTRTGRGDILSMTFIPSRLGTLFAAPPLENASTQITATLGAQDFLRDVILAKFDFANLQSLHRRRIHIKAPSGQTLNIQIDNTLAAAPVETTVQFIFFRENMWADLSKIQRLGSGLKQKTFNLITTTGLLTNVLSDVIDKENGPIIGFSFEVTSLKDGEDLIQYLITLTIDSVAVVEKVTALAFSTQGKFIQYFFPLSISPGARFDLAVQKDLVTSTDDSIAVSYYFDN